MSRLDYCHPQVVRALEKDGWDVNNVPLRLEIHERVIYIDVEASRYTNGSRQQFLLAEVKCFPDKKSTAPDLYMAVGQYLIYQAVLAEAHIPTPLYLAIPAAIYDTVFDKVIRRAIEDNRLKLVIVDLEAEVIRQWIE